jgi:hypothetical protein
MRIGENLQQDPSLLDTIRKEIAEGNAAQNTDTNNNTNTAAQLEQNTNDNTIENNPQSAVTSTDSLENSADKHSRNLIDITA